MNLDGIIRNLTAPGPRLPLLWEWLKNEVWSAHRYNTLMPENYLIEGEKQACALEEILSAAADRAYGELIQTKSPERSILEALKNPHTAVIVFDGLSIRELPLIEILAEKSGFSIRASGHAHAAIPSETLSFIDQNLGLDKVAPSQLTTRRELKEKGIKAVYAESNTAAPNLEYDEPLLIWSAFPDNTYLDSGARFAEHFGNLHALFETAWINLVQGIRGKKKIIVTSDHGYVYFGAGLDVERPTREQKTLNDFFGNERYRETTNAVIPESTDIFRDDARHVAIIKGRVKTRSTGPAAQKLYKHGGLSLMEMITPWVELEVG